MTSTSKKFLCIFKIKFHTKRIFRIFPILRISGMAPFCNLFIERSSYKLFSHNTQFNQPINDQQHCASLIFAYTQQDRQCIKLTFQFHSPKCPSAACVLQTALSSPESEAGQVQVQCYSYWCWLSWENWRYHSSSSCPYQSQSQSLTAQLLLLHK